MSPQTEPTPAGFLVAGSTEECRRDEFQLVGTSPGVYICLMISKPNLSPLAVTIQASLCWGAKFFHYKFYGGLTVFKDAQLRLGDFMAGQASNFRKPVCRCKFILHRTPPRCLCRPSQLA